MSHDHGHGTATQADRGRLQVVLVITLTVMVAEADSAPWATSVAVTDLVPVVLNVTRKTLLPASSALNVQSAGSEAVGSSLVK